MRFKTIIRNINVLNIVLMATIAVCAAYILPPLLHVQVKYTLPSPKKTVEEKEEKTVQTQPSSPLEYTIIAEQNVFHPERKIPADKSATPPLPKPEFVLYGTLITNDISLAFIEDLKAAVSTPGKGKRQKALRKGETMSGFTLKEIETDKIVMVRGEERIEVRITDKARAKSAGTVSPPQGPSAPSVSRPAQPSVQPPRVQTNDVRKRREALRNMSEK